MKFLTGKEVPAEIDWSKPNWVRLIDNPAFLVITTGNGQDGCFFGMCMPCKEHPFGMYSESWHKEKFELVPGTVMFPISNEI